MLVLTRHVNEKILIGDDIAITVCRIEPDSVRLGIGAPRELDILRAELAMQNAKKLDDGREIPA